MKVSELSKELDNKIEENFELQQAKDKAVAQLDIIAADRETAKKQLQGEYSFCHYFRINSNKNFEGNIFFFYVYGIYDFYGG